MYGNRRRNVKAQMQSPRLAIALSLAKRGIPVFPCVVDGKEPATANGFKDATTDAIKIGAWWAIADYNVAIEPEKAGWAVIDIDGEWEGLSGMPDTYSVRTPRGGLHLYYAGSCHSSVKKIAPNVDTRGIGGYVLVPPSVVNGKPYTVDRTGAMTPLPGWIEPALQARKNVALAGTGIEDQEAAERRGRALLAGEIAKGVVLEGTRDNTAFKVACWLRDAGCDPELSLALMREVWNTHCVPPLDDDVLRQKIDSASRNSQNEAGAYAAARASTTFQDIVPEAPPEPARKALPEPIMLSDLAGDEKPVEMVVHQWIQKHKFNIFRGRGGANKSRLALEWAMLCDAGMNKAGFTVEKCTAVYVSCEDDREEMKRRRNAMARKFAIKSSGVVYFDMTDEDDAFLADVSDDGGVVRTEKWDDLERRLKDIQGHKLLVLDSTYDVINFGGSTKNSDTHVRTVIRLLDRLCRRADCTIICLWHPSRAGMARGDEGGFATAWENTTRNAISIKKLEDDDTFELKAEKRNNMAVGKPVILRWSEGVLNVITDDDAQLLMEHEIAVDVALEAAAANQPIQMKQKPATWVFEVIKERSGRIMSLKDLREVLSRESRRASSRIKYNYFDPQKRDRPAGWFPSDPKKEDWE